MAKETKLDDEKAMGAVSGIAGTLGVATVVEKLARGFIDDGRLSIEEINSAFNSVDKKAN
jgi:hypothetical protein